MALIQVPAAASAGLLDKSMLEAGFEVPKSIVAVPRLSVATRAPTKCGKSYWAIMTTPEPVAVIALDPGTNAVIDKALAEGRKLVVRRIAHNRKNDQATAKKLWFEFKAACLSVAHNKAIRTLVVDTCSEVWEMLRLAEFGKLSQVKGIHYGPINSEMDSFINELYYMRPDLNFVYTHKVKKNYIADQWDGKSMELLGFGGIDYLVDLSITNYFMPRSATTPASFGFLTEGNTATRFGPAFSGLKFEGVECNFIDLALHIFTEKGDKVGSDPTYWL